MATDWIWSGLWRITITPRSGNPATFQSGDGILSRVEIVLQSGGMSTFSFALVNDDGVYNDDFSFGDTVEVWLDPGTGVVGTTKRLKGFIKKIGYKRAGVNNTLMIKGFSYVDKFKRTIVHEIYKGTRTYEDIITSSTDGLLAKYAPEISGSGVQVTGKSLGTNETLKFDYVDLYESLGRIQNIVGDWIFEVTPALVLNFQMRGYTDNIKTIEDFDDVYFEHDDDKLTNRVYVFGGKDYSIVSKASWAGTASLNNVDAPKAHDNNPADGWDSGAAQGIGDWYKLDMGTEVVVGRLMLDNLVFGATKYARSFKVEASKNNVEYDYIIGVSGNTSPTILIDFPQEGYRYIRLTLTAADVATWAIGEIYLYSYYNLLSKLDDLASQTEYGLYERVLRDSTITTKAQSKSRGQTEIATHKDGDLSGEVVLFYFFDCSPNELILINVPGTPVNQKFVVQQVSYSEDTYGSFQERIFLRRAT